jgi:hypothetical protein
VSLRHKIANVILEFHCKMVELPELSLFKEKGCQTIRN